MKSTLSSITFLFLLVFLTPSFSTAQKTRINHVAFSVHNLQRSTHFYRQVIGLDTIPEPFRDGRHTWFRTGDYSQLHLIQNEGAIITPPKSTHLCFSTPSMTAFLEALTRAGIPYEDLRGKRGSITLRADGIRQVYLQDPDGYWLEINDDAPKKE